MASLQLTLKDNLSTRLRRRRKETLASLTQLLKQPGLTVRKTSKKYEIIPTNISKRTSNNNAEIKTTNVINKQNIRCYNIAGNINRTDILKNIVKKKPVINIGREYTVANISKQKSNSSTAIPTLKQTKKGQNKVKIDAKGDTEFYPEKTKRNVASKRIVLKPKHDYRVIATTNKRKRCTPVRDTTSTKRIKPPSPGPSPITAMDYELVMNEDLTDEDLMEILTCESPVWWEDPPDEGFDEEPIGRRSLPSSNSSLPQTEKILESSNTTELLAQTEKMPESSKTIKPLAQTEKLRESSKTIPPLAPTEKMPESSKTIPPQAQIEKIPESPQAPTEKIPELLKPTPPLATQNTDTIKNKILHNNQQLNEKKSKLERLLNNIKEMKVKIKENEDPEKEGKSRKNSTDSSDISICDDDIIKSLESVEIPIITTNLENNELPKNIEEHSVNTKMPVSEIKDKSCVEKDIQIPIVETKNKSLEKDTQISIVEIKNIPLVEKNTKLPLLVTKDKSFVEKASKITIVEKKNKPLVEKDPQILTAATKNKSLIEKDTQIPTVAIREKYFVKKHTQKPIVVTKDKSFVVKDPKITIVEIKNKSLVEKDTQIPTLATKDKSFVEKDTHIPILATKDKAFVESDTKLPIEEIKNNSVVESPSKNVKKLIPVILKKDATVPILERRDDDFEKEIPTNLISNQFSMKKDSQIQILEIKDDQNELIPEYYINKTESTISVEKQNLVKKPRIKYKKIQKDDQILSKIDAKTPIPEIEDVQNIESSKIEPFLENNNVSPEVNPSKSESVNDMASKKPIENIEQDIPINIDKEVTKVEESSHSPRKINKRSPKKIKITKICDTTSTYPKILRKSRNRINIRKINSQNSNVVNNEITPNHSNDVKTNNNKNRLSLIRQHYLEILRKRNDELSNFTDIPNTKNKCSVNDSNAIINKETCIKNSNINYDNDFCIQNSSLNADNELRNCTDTSDSSINDNNIKSGVDSSIIVDNTLNVIDTNTNDSELSINCNNINSDNSIKMNNEIPMNLPKLIKIPNNIVHSPISIKSTNSDSTDNDNYTISDSNVTYIDEYVDREKTDELVTVYKILTGPEKNEERNQYLNVPGGNMKYCYNCSTIFETENCLYCFKKVVKNLTVKFHKT